MNETDARLRARPGLELVEEGVRLLRSVPPVALLWYFVGAAPCLLYAIYFFTDLSRNAFASEHVVGEALIFAVLYGWMKCWQAIFAAQLSATLMGQPPRPWNASRLARLVAAQVLLQPAGLLLRAAAAAILLPYVWVATFFQNVSVLGESEGGVVALCREAWSETKRWSSQAHGIAWYLTVAGLFVYLNVATLILAIPSLLKSFLGIETVFSRHPQGLLEPTFFVTVAVITHLLLDPLRKAVVALRCFYGRSLASGEDLAVGLTRVRRSLARVAPIVASLILFCAGASLVHAEPPEARVEAVGLDRSIGEVLERREFTWRAAREKTQPADEAKLSTLEKWRRDLIKWRDRTFQKAQETLSRAWRRFIDWLFPKRGDQSQSRDAQPWWNSAQLLFWIALAAVVVLCVFLIVRRGRRPLVTAATAEAIAVEPDLREETVSADLLPEEGWLRLARELFERSELRLALRAFYLAGLAHLGHRELIRLARHKSDRDYDRELRRRAATQEDLLAAFATNLVTFESGWYGDHPVTPDALRAFEQNLERIRAC